MSDSSDETELMCPVCKRHDRSEAVASQGIVLTGMQALVDMDDPTIENVFQSLTPYDGHTAIALCLMLMTDLCDIVGADIRQLLAEYRKNLNASQAQGQ